MKNAINYYYDLYPINVYQNEKVCKFSLNNVDYCLLQYNYDEKKLNNIFEIHNIVRKYNIYCHEIIKNKYQELITSITNKNYVLLKLSKFNDEKLTVNSLLYYPYATSVLHLERFNTWNNWRNLWIERVDYFEYQVLNFKKKYPVIQKTSSYYIGMAETAIQLLLGLEVEPELCISHRRIKKEYTLFDLYNPLEFIIDYKVRDVAEYFKEQFFYDKIELEDITYYIDNHLFDNSQALLFFSRLLYPSYYFDVCNDIIYKNIDEKNIYEIISKISDYEQFLKNIFYSLKSKFEIPEIEWIKKS